MNIKPDKIIEIKYLFMFSDNNWIYIDLYNEYPDYITPKNTAVKKFSRVLTDYPKRFCIPKNQTTKN